MLDLLITLGALLALSVIAGIAWAVCRGIQILLQTGNTPAPDTMLIALGQPSAIAMIWMTLISTGGTALLVYYWRRRATPEEQATSRAAACRWATWGWVCLTALVTVSVSTLLGLLGQRWGVQPEPTNQALIKAAYSEAPVFMMVFGTLMAPAYEELLFRRVLFGRLWAAGRPWLGVVISSVAFALMHEVPGVTQNDWRASMLLWLTYGFMGAAFAFDYWRTRTLWAAIGAHALNNVIALTLLNLSVGG
ncbi:MAG: CPBP family intramembrane glutamic endopeptidase [Pseudoxanthomonas sp.]